MCEEPDALDRLLDAQHHLRRCWRSFDAARGHWQGLVAAEKAIAEQKRQARKVMLARQEIGLRAQRVYDTRREEWRATFKR